MANVEIDDLTLKATVDSTDELILQETGGGSSRKTTAAGLRITQSQITDFGSSYGELYEDNDSGSTISVTYLDVYYGWTTATAGEVSGSGYVTADVADSTADNLTIGASGAGTYLCSAYTSFGGSNSAVVKAYAFINGVQTSLGYERKLGATGSDVGSASFVGFLDLAASDYVDLRFTSDGNGDSVYVYRCRLILHRM